MSQRQDEDELLEEALRWQRQLADFYKRAAKDAPEKQCKQMFERLRDGLEEQVGDVARELARHRMERGLGQPIDHQQ